MSKSFKPKQSQAERDYLINRFNSMREIEKIYYDDNDMVMIQLVEDDNEIIIEGAFCNHEGDPTENYVDLTDNWLMDMEE
jgi:predicted ATPase